jgi:hypothetical protein
VIQVEVNLEMLKRHFSCCFFSAKEDTVDLDFILSTTTSACMDSRAK